MTTQELHPVEQALDLAWNENHAEARELLDKHGYDIVDCANYITEEYSTDADSKLSALFDIITVFNETRHKDAV